MKPSDITITTSCDRNYIWGAYLLAASAHRFETGVPIHVLAEGFTKEDASFLTQFPGTRVIPLEGTGAPPLNRSKPYAMLTAESEWMMWIDADCIVVGDIRPYILPENDQCQMTLRVHAEICWHYWDRYEPGEAMGSIPRRVLRQWQEDVGDLAAPRMLQSINNCVIVVHRRHREFIQRWDQQMSKVLPRESRVVERESMAYKNTDEAVLNSMLAYSSLAPEVSPNRLAPFPTNHIAHFGGSPKPWQAWQLRLWRYYDVVQDVLSWAKFSNYRIPPLPWSLRHEYRAASYGLALAMAGRARLKGAVRDRVRVLRNGPQASLHPDEWTGYIRRQLP